jgi:hypothetical protein
LSTINILHHEPWRDEMAAWMVAKYNSFHGILQEARIEAQPGLWYLVIKAVQLVFPRPLGMALANVFFMALAVLLLLRYAPFARLEKFFLCLGYMILYEYGTISRNYAMSVFFIFAVCALYPRRKKYLILIAILLAVSCSIQTMNIIVALCFAFLLIVEKMYVKRPTAHGRLQNAHLVLAVLIIAIGIFLALRQATPPPGSPWSLSSTQKWVFHSPLGALRTMWLSFAPLASPTLHFWNTNVLPEGRLMTIFSFVILIVSGLFFIRKPLISLFYGSGVMLFLLFFYRFYHGFARHHGYIFLMFIVSYWISFSFDVKKPEDAQLPPKGQLAVARFNVFTLACAVNFCAVFVPLYFDWKYPFSASRDVGRYLVDNHLQDAVLLGDVDFYVAPIAGWVDREMYYPAIGDFSKTVVWAHPDRRRIVMEEIAGDRSYHEAIWQMAIKLAKKSQKDVVVILNYPIDETLLKKFSVSIVADETYFLYRVQCAPSRTPGDVSVQSPERSRLVP